MGSKIKKLTPLYFISSKTSNESVNKISEIILHHLLLWALSPSLKILILKNA